MDKITEAISHFVGLFEITLEQIRQRAAYDEFKALQALMEETPDLPNHNVNVKVGFDFAGYAPHVPYVPLPPEQYWYTPFSKLAFAPPEVPVPTQPLAAYPGFIYPEGAGVFSAGRAVLPDLIPPGSVAVIINQDIRLFDNDYVGVGGHGLRFTPPAADHGAELAALMDAAMELSPFDEEPEMPGSTEEIIAFIEASTQQLRDYPEDGHGEADVFVVKANTIEGVYVNGQLVEEDDLPKLDDHLPEHLRKKDEEEEEEEHSEHCPPGCSGSAEIEVSVELQAGGNFLANQVLLSNNWLQAPVTAVMGNHVELNAIVQITARCDTDAVTSTIGNWSLGDSDPTQAFNIAMFKRVDPSAGSTASPAKQGDFPENWIVTRLEGDLMIMNWIEQFAFMMDNDVAILSSSGVKTMVTTGHNKQFNDVSLEELGFNYDLIVVGGSIYDASLIFQLAVLMDNDLIGAVNDFQTTGEGSVSTDGNLLWNQASIVNYGAADRFQEMSEAYRKACESLKNGGQGDLSDILGDSAFAGLAGLRVLYITGDIINLNYIKQCTVLGDNDQVALAMDAMLAHPAADWILTTGSNALVNYAAIADMDSTGKTYVGGGVYSDEILIQAELVSSDPELGGQNPDVLVNEAVAFLDDDMAADKGAPAASSPSLAPDTTYSDPMQSVLA
jgi:hypothetical protein